MERSNSNHGRAVRVLSKSITLKILYKYRNRKQFPSRNSVFICFLAAGLSNSICIAEESVTLDDMTVEDSRTNSRAKCGWQKFTDHVIEVINQQCEGVVFLLWGKPAQEKAKSVNPNKHCILKTSHPSPLSASQGFLTSSMLCLK